MIKTDVLIIGTAVLKDLLRLLFGIFIYGIDLEITGTFFAELAPAFIVLGWAENVDSEYLLDAKSEDKSQTNFYLYFGIAIILFYAIFGRELLQFILIYFISRLGYMYYRTEILERNKHQKLMKQNFFEIVLLLILCFTHSYVDVKWLLCIYLVLPSIPSLTDTNRLSAYKTSVFNNYSISNVSVIFKPRSISLVFKNLTGNLDMMALEYLGNPEAAGLIKYIKSLGNGLNLIINKVVERYRSSYLKVVVKTGKRKRIIYLIVGLLVIGYLFGVVLLQLLIPILGRFVSTPVLPSIVILYFTFIAVSPIVRITYLYSSSMSINVVAQAIVTLGICILYILKVKEFPLYLIMPVTIGLAIYIYHVTRLSPK